MTNAEYYARMVEQIEADKIRKLPHPEQVFELGRRDPLVRAHVNQWRNGDLTWEQMLIALVTLLSERCQAYGEAELKRFLAAPVSFVEKGTADVVVDGDWKGGPR